MRRIAVIAILAMSVASTWAPVTARASSALTSTFVRDELGDVELALPLDGPSDARIDIKDFRYTYKGRQVAFTLRFATLDFAQVRGITFEVRAASSTNGEPGSFARFFASASGSAHGVVTRVSRFNGGAVNCASSVRLRPAIKKVVLTAEARCFGNPAAVSARAVVGGTSFDSAESDVLVGPGVTRGLLRITDSVGDVLDGDGQPATDLVDITDVVIAYDRRTHLDVEIHFAELTTDSWGQAYLDLDVEPGSSLTDLFVRGMKQLDPDIRRVGGEPIPCDVTFDVDDAANAMRFSVPSSCLGAPKSVGLLTRVYSTSPSLPGDETAEYAYVISA